MPWIYCQFIISANKKENVAYLILHVESHSWILCFLTWMKLAIAYNWVSFPIWLCIKYIKQCNPDFIFISFIWSLTLSLAFYFLTLEKNNHKMPFKIHVESYEWKCHVIVNHFSKIFGKCVCVYIYCFFSTVIHSYKHQRICQTLLPWCRLLSIRASI